MPYKDPEVRRQKQKIYDHRHYEKHKNQVNAWVKKWREANPEAVKVAHRKSYRKHKKKKNEFKSLWNKLHPEECLRYQRNWVGRNRTKKRDGISRYWARKRGASGFHTFEQWMARVEYFGWRCVYCKLALTVKTLTQDHVKPISKGGSDWASNLVPACKGCNSSKSNKWGK
jgi:5-methylcytosine-specific restriction endonuclease McrA